MSTSKKLALGLAALLAIVVVAVGIWKYSATPGGTISARVGTMGDAVDYAPFMIARDQKWFEEAFALSVSSRPYACRDRARGPVMFAAEEPVGCRVDLLTPSGSTSASPHPRQGGQWKGQVVIAPDFDILPDDIQEALGIRDS